MAAATQESLGVLRHHPNTLALHTARRQPATMSQGMAVSNYKADEKETARNKKKLMALVKQPGNIVCADCPAKRESFFRN